MSTLLWLKVQGFGVEFKSINYYQEGSKVSGNRSLVPKVIDSTNIPQISVKQGR